MMASLLVLALVLFAGSCYGEHRIVGGETTNIERYPSLVQVDFLNAWSNTWSQSCAGTILNEVYILSAAHCFEGTNYNPNQRRIRAGASYRNTGGIIVSVAWEHNHPSYSVASRWDSDITVVRLAGFLILSPTIQQAPIVNQNAVIPDFMPVVAVGWGSTGPGSDYSLTLQHTTLFTVNLEICRQRYASLPAVVTTNMVCAGLLDIGGRDHCQGDAGGPLFYGNFVYGILSWGQGCADPNFPGVSTAVAQFTEWIIRTAV